MPRAKMARKKLPFKVTSWDTVGFTIGTEAANAISVTGQLRDENGANFTTPTTLDVYISAGSDAAGADVVGTAPTGGVAIGAQGKILAAVVAGKVLKVATNATGAFILTITEAGALAFRVVCVKPDGGRAVSSIVQFA